LRLLLSSTNENKLRELRVALPEWDIALVGAPDEPVEDGKTFLDNARIKARHGRDHAPAWAWVVGEDSGIEVDALGGRPGVESARWATDGVAQLLVELGASGDRRARYVCELVDPIFVPRGESSTVAELGDAWKSQNSHRAVAARALAEMLAER
jgi:XTP/dITP diphosphohydrolase